MDFSRKKLPKERAETLLRTRIETIQPYSLMPAPVYVYLRANEKLVSIKGPLDFFTREELDRFKNYEYFYLLEFAASVAPFQEVGLKVREALSWGMSPRSVSLKGAKFTGIVMPPIPYVISDEILSLL